MAKDGESGPSMPPSAIILLCLLGAGALLLCCWALFRHFFHEPEERSMEISQINPEDGLTQAQYMRVVRLRNQEFLQAKYGYQNRYPSSQYMSKTMMTNTSSVMSV
ncbi:hypothetical protein CB0940_03355 [Cercospora beticola]|uniref:Uncharacterized protein n=1 Tax=Cercospora beticola TaxID=122368 RepID=A0A2G5I5E5_CERBT|nr:hypothetical protein CB0940_03355 [Cercospora beticola]PIB00038.1 hypothetical protein CB0940_03355 [Cercospora beticola]WPB00531.1 hypothetical protein RHO25_005151 [Cercospora beticola]CAK1361251.1 unnamed protein product [Cercospora beticola]